jgi:hypothetical protein
LHSPEVIQHNHGSGRRLVRAAQFELFGAVGIRENDVTDVGVETYPLHDHREDSMHSVHPLRRASCV